MPTEQPFDDIINRVREPFCLLGRQTAGWIGCGIDSIPGFGKVFSGIVNEEQQRSIKNAGCAYIESFQKMFDCI